MGMTWTNKMAVGVDQIDTQHKELFDRINLLLDAMMTGKGKDEITKTLSFLESYANKHFSEEEALQRNSNYPKYDEQRVQHEAFKNQLKQLRNTFEKEGASSTLAINTQKQMSAWWNSHIMRMDTDLGKYLNDNKKL